MSRITAPASKLTRAMGSASTASLRDSSAHTCGAILMPKYAELLRTSRSSSDHHEVSLLMQAPSSKPRRWRL